MNMEPGMRFYDTEAQANAEVEQVRAEALEVLRTATSYSLAAVAPDGRTFCSTIATEGDAILFLAYAAGKSFRNLAVIAGTELAHNVIDATLEVLEGDDA